MVIESKIRAALLQNSERPVSKVLSAYPEVIRWLCCRTAGHSTYVLCEFPFGSNYRADFVVATSFSGAWHVHFVELEPTKDIIITKKGLPSNRLNTAISQTKDWELFVKQNSTLFKQDLTKWCMTKDLLKVEDPKLTPTNYTNNLLNSPETVIWYYFHIVIGRREKTDQFKYGKIQQNKTYSMEIHTYDRLLDISRKLDLHNVDPSLSLTIREDHGI